jgi:hypothetical protein
MIPGDRFITPFQSWQLINVTLLICARLSATVHQNLNVLFLSLIFEDPENSSISTEPLVHLQLSPSIGKAKGGLGAEEALCLEICRNPQGLT